MKILGQEVDNNYVIVATGTCTGLGLCYALYKILKRFGRKEDIESVLEVVEDVKLPLLLEHDFGDFRATCATADPIASAYLKQLPEQFFQFNENLSNFISELIRKKKFARCRNALVIGSTTGRLAFDLARYFRQVRGIDNFFARVVTCYRLQNNGEVQYDFPLEGSHRTVGKTAHVSQEDEDSDLQDIVDAETLEFKSVDRLLKRKKPVEVVEFTNLDVSSVPLNLGQFQVVFLTDEINELIDPENILKNVHRYVEKDGLLVIYTDYNWLRTTNQVSGFPKAAIKTSVDLLKFMLRGFFDLLEEKYILDAIGQSLRSCLLRNVHVTVWERNSRPILP